MHLKSYINLRSDSCFPLERPEIPELHSDRFPRLPSGCLIPEMIQFSIK